MNRNSMFFITTVSGERVRVSGGAVRIVIDYINAMGPNFRFQDRRAVKKFVDGHTT